MHAIVMKGLDMQMEVRPLFRQEVLDAKRGEWLGTIELAMPVSYRLLAGASLLACILLVVFLIFGRYTRHERVIGQLVPSLGLLTRTAPSAGTVARTLVQEGDSVAQDQALIEISAETNSLAIGEARVAIGQELNAQRRRKLDALESQGRLTAQKEAVFRSSILLYQQQLTQIDSQIALQIEQAQNATDLWHRLQLQTANNDASSSLQTEHQKAAALGARAEVAALRRQRADIEQQLNQQKTQLHQLPLTAAADRDALQQKIIELDQALAQNEVQHDVVLRAARAGIVSDMAIKDGETVTAGQRLLTIIPKDALLQAELWLPSRAIGFISLGDHVVLRYQAFPYQKFGQQFGSVRNISRSATYATELSNRLGRTMDEPLYRVVVDLEQQHILAYGRLENLKPGMTLDADILLDSRRLIEWVFEPLFGFGRTTLAQR